MKKLILIVAALALVCLLALFYLPDIQMDVPRDPTDPEATTTAGADPETTVSTAPTVPTTQAPIPDGWLEENGNRYYYLDGQRVTGWQEVEGLNRYFLADGSLAHGFQDVDGSRYLLDAEGCMLTGWQDVENKRYFLGEDGVLFTGWLQQEDVLYYLKEDGTMARGCVEIEGVNAYFTSTGAYILVLNPWSFLPEGYEPDLVELSSSYATSGNKVDRSCYDSLIAMMKACNKEEPGVCVLSGYRSVEKQTRLFNKQVQRNLNKGYSQEEAERLAAQVVAVPGTSEHHSGLAVDIIDTRLWALEEEQEDLPAQKWLMEHCWEYGFILRYPKDKIEVTGIIYEPWHYRYVGKELAKELHDLGLTLEEYMTMLTEQEA